MQITDYTFANITARPFMTVTDVNNKWILTEDTKHVINVCMHQAKESIELIKAKGATYDWFPTDERPMDVNIVQQAVAKLAEYDRDGSHIIVHCLHGNNRSRTVVEAYHYAKFSTHYEDEYRGYTNHLIWNCAKGYLPPLPEIEKRLSQIVSNTQTIDRLIEQVYSLITEHNITCDIGYFLASVRRFLEHCRDVELLKKVKVDWFFDQESCADVVTFNWDDDPLTASFCWEIDDNSDYGFQWEINLGEDSELDNGEMVEYDKVGNEDESAQRYAAFFQSLLKYTRRCHIG